MNRLFARHACRIAVGMAACTLASLTLAGAAMADSAPGDGHFVIGDQNSVALGAQVTFWGAQWWKDNPLSTGFAPPSFKGYADNASDSCGQSWTTAPGNSSHPPASLGSGDIEVIVSSAISKDGPVISGDTEAVVIVAPDPGYAGDPGHPGTGTVVGYVCGAGPDGLGGGGGILI